MDTVVDVDQLCDVTLVVAGVDTDTIVFKLLLLLFSDEVFECFEQGGRPSSSSAASSSRNSFGSGRFFFGSVETLLLDGCFLTVVEV